MKNLTLTTAMTAGLLLALAGCGGATATGEGAATASGEPRYEIRLHRPLQAGQVFSVRVETEQQLDVVTEAEAPADDDLSISLHLLLEGTVSVVASAEDGHISRALFEITRGENLDTGDAIFEPGSVMTIERWGADEVDLTMASGELSDEQLRALLLSFPFRRPGSPTGEALMGTDESKAVGESWDVDQPSFARELRENGVSVDERRITGTTTLSGVEACAGGAECLVLESSLTATGASLEREGLDLTVGSGEITAEVRVRAPTSTTEFLRSEEARLRGNFTVREEGEDGTVTREITLRRVRVAQYTPAAP